MALNYAAVTVEHREVELKDKPRALLQVSAKGTVPVLVLADGRVIDESAGVMGWALLQQDPNTLTGGHRHLVLGQPGLDRTRLACQVAPRPVHQLGDE